MISCFYCRLDNFGDAINPFLLERVFHVPIRWTTKKTATLCGIGSILTVFARPPNKFSGYLTRALMPPINVWSSGFIEEPPLHYRFIRKMHFWALRGKLSLKAAERLQEKNIHVPLGDGGLLCSMLLDHRPDKQYALGLVPHVADFGNPLFRQLQEVLPHTTVIDLRGSPLVALKKIASCENILSSSLHGLIAADSLGIPNRWIEVSDRVDGHRYKFKDYYSVFGKEKINPLIPPICRKQLTHVFERTIVQSHCVKKIQNALLKTFPEGNLSF